MIAPMKKAHIFFTKASTQTAMEQIRAMGIVHVCVETEPDTVLSVNQSEDEITLTEIRKALTLIKSISVGKKNKKEKVIFDLQNALEICRNANNIATRKYKIDAELRVLEEEIRKLLPWGDFEPEDIHFLHRSGIYLQLYEVPVRSFRKHFSTSYLLLSKKKGLARLICVNTEKEIENSDYTPRTLPAKSLSMLRKEKKLLLEEDSRLNYELQKIAEQSAQLQAAEYYYQERIALSQAYNSIQERKSICWISAFIPLSSVAELHKAAKQEGWGVLVRDPLDDETPPTLIRGPRLFQLVRPIFDMFGTLPGYREFDISSWFLLFFTVFFTLIVSDAGYAAFFLIFTVYSILRIVMERSRIPKLLSLMILLSTTALLWGSITANYFGSQPIIPFLDRLVFPQLSVWNPASTQRIQLLSILIGTVHISIAYCWRFIRALGGKHKLSSLAELGWIASIISLFFIILPLAIDAHRFSVPSFAAPLLGIGFVFVVFFAEQKGAFFRGILKGLLGVFKTAFDNISLFSDIISYIRLYAVGLATFAVAKSFNQLAGNVAENGGFPALAVAGLILVLGHGLNLAMCLLSVIVHGIRLNMLEFSANLGVEWNGYPYTPLQESIKEGEKI